MKKIPLPSDSPIERRRLTCRNAFLRNWVTHLCDYTCARHVCVCVWVAQWYEVAQTAKRVKPAVDATITIFCDFWQFLAKKLAFFSKIYVMIKNFHNLASFWVKNASFFAEFFGKNI
jgi:hypothetical protein